MRVALYVRRSTDAILQAESLNTQEEILRRYAAEKDLEIVEIYRDSASGRTADRPEFGRLLADVENHPRFAALLVRDVSRWGRFDNIDESAYWEFLLHLHGVRVVFVEEAFTREASPFGALLKAMRRTMAAEFSRDKSRLVHAARVRGVRAGNWLGGVAPYGYRRALVDPAGEIIQVLPTGQRKLINAHRVKLTFGPPEEVAVVREIFASFAHGVPILRIVRQLNDRRVPSARGTRWSDRSVQIIVLNIAYAGKAALRFVSDSSSDPQVVVSNGQAWPAIIDEKTWKEAQARAAAVVERHSLAHRASQVAEFFVSSNGTEPSANGEASLAASVVAKACDGADRKLMDDGKKAWIDFTRELARRTSVQVDENAIRVGDGKLRISFKAVYPKFNTRGGMNWRFEFDENDTQEITIGFALTPQGRLFSCHKYRNLQFKRPTVVRTISAPRAAAGRYTVERCLGKLLRDIMRLTGARESLFLGLVSQLEIMDTAGVARALDCSPDQVRLMYHRLRSAGHHLPPLRMQRNHHVAWMCDGCGAVRKVSIAHAMAKRTSLCRRCYAAQLAASCGIWVTCPDCGSKRRMGRSRFAELSSGADTPCGRCSAARIARTVTYPIPPAEYVTAVCPDCGRRRRYSRTNLKSLSNGPATRCRDCSMRRWWNRGKRD